MSGVQLAIDIALPDEAVAISDLPDIGEQPDAAAVQVAAQAVAEAQRQQRVALLESHGLGLTQHLLSDSGPLSPALLGALRIAMLTGEELRSLPADTDPCRGPLSAASERKTCDTLRAVLGGLIEEAAAVQACKASATASWDGAASSDDALQACVLQHSLRAVGVLEALVEPMAPEGGAKRRRTDGDSAVADAERQRVEQELARVRRQRAAAEEEEARLEALLRQLSPQLSPPEPQEREAPSRQQAPSGQQAPSRHQAPPGQEAPSGRRAAPLRPCGAIGGAWSEHFLTACGAAHDEHMGCGDMVRVRVRVSYP